MPNGSGKHQRAPLTPRKQTDVDTYAEFERLTGYRIGSPGWLECIHPDDRQRVLDEWAAAQRSGRICIEYRLRFRDGHTRYVRGVARRSRGILRVKWIGYIRPVEKDHTHRCESVKCYCPVSRIK